MIGWCSRDMAERGQCGSNGRIHADPTCPYASDPLVLVDIRDGLLYPSGRESKGILVKWCGQCERPEMPGDWADRAACLGLDQGWFFPSLYGRYDQGKQVCASCPVLDDCREFALAHEPGGGLWGGMTEREREERRATLAAGQRSP